VTPADGIQRSCLSGPVSYLLEQRQGLLAVREVLRGNGLAVEDVPEIKMDTGLPDPVVQLPVKVQGMTEMSTGHIGCSELAVGLAEKPPRMRLSANISQTARGGQGHMLHGLPFFPVGTFVEEVRQCPRQLPGLVIEPGLGR